MASKPNPSWSEPQRKVFKQIQEATELAIPYFGPEIPVLDNLTDEQMCDQVGLLKAARKAFENSEKAHIERFKGRLGGRLLLRGDRFEATNTPSTRTGLNQGKAKALLERADAIDIDLTKLLGAIETGEVELPSSVHLDYAAEVNDEKIPITNTEKFFDSTPVSTLRVEEIA